MAGPKKISPSMEILSRLVKASLLAPEVQPFAERSVRAARHGDTTPGTDSLWAGILDDLPSGAADGGVDDGIGRVAVLQHVDIDKDIPEPALDKEIELVEADIAAEPAEVQPQEVDAVEDKEADAAANDYLSGIRTRHVARGTLPDFDLLADLALPAPAPSTEAEVPAEAKAENREAEQQSERMRQQHAAQDPQEDEPGRNR